MSTCKDCVYYTGCWGILNDFGMTLDPKRDPCDNFKDSSRFVELPCKLIGAHAYKINQDGVIVKGESNGAFLSRCTKAIRFRWENDDEYLVDFDNIEKIIFPTQEEAEQALKERESNAGRNDI